MTQENNVSNPTGAAAVPGQEAQGSFAAQQAGSAQAYAAQASAQPQPQARARQAASAQGVDSASFYAQSPYAQPAPVYVTNQPQSSKAPWIVLGVIALLIVASFAFAAVSCSSAVGALASAGSSAGDAAFSDGDQVAVIDINGTIQYDGSACSPEGLANLLDQAESDDSVKAVVLRVDSGGGTATAGEEMAEYVKRFGKPVVVSSASMNCSAAYEISSAADEIYVNKSTAIGAIGTAMQVTDLSELLDMLGVSVDNITSAESKDSSYGTRPLTDEERQYYQDLVDAINETFIENVADGRGMTMGQVRELATGLQFTGEQAIENGLADKVGIFDDAIDEAARLGGIDGDYDVVYLGASDDLSTLLDVLGSSESNTQVSAAAEKLVELLRNEGVLQ